MRKIKCSSWNENSIMRTLSAPRRDTLARWILSDLTITVSDPISHRVCRFPAFLFFFFFCFSFLCMECIWLDAKSIGHFFLFFEWKFEEGFYGGINDLVLLRLGILCRFLRRRLKFHRLRKRTLVSLVFMVLFLWSSSPEIKCFTKFWNCDLASFPYI